MTLALTATSRAAAPFQKAGLPSDPPVRSPRPEGLSAAPGAQSPAYSISDQRLSSDNAVIAQSETEAEADPNQLTEEEQEIVDDLRQRDREVRQHEQAHAAKGGPYAGSPSYDTVRGPDGASYAVGGEVKIDASPVRGDPEATIRKMEVVKRAALAPSEPSAQDRAVAAQADAQKAQAQAELRQQRAEERGEGNSPFETAAAEDVATSYRAGGMIDRYRQAAELAASERAKGRLGLIA
ncbi:hypothetical protein GH722_17960 [Alphaproteobacteria bacterium HT1-32]|nr:hypothetical protein [Alphaproteobacteria bacterium HT1-32]